MAAVEWPWQVPRLTLAQLGFLSPCRDTTAGTVGSFQSGGAFAGQRACLLMSGYAQGHQPRLKETNF